MSRTCAMPPERGRTRRAGGRRGVLVAAVAVLFLGACGGGTNRAGDGVNPPMTRDERQAARTQGRLADLFYSPDPNVTVGVNRYLWQASMEVLDFLPIQSVDPFTGVIVTGYGAPPGGGRAYRATIHVQDAALDARSLKVALQTQGGTPVAAETRRAVEDAILTRARQLRIRDGKL